MKNEKLTVKELAELGMALAIIETAKFVLDFVPNVELVTLLFIVFTLFFDKKMLLVAIGFTLIECALKGIQVWVLIYLYIWPLLILIVCAAKRHKAGRLFYCVLSGMYGFLFGLLCVIPYFFIGGPQMALTWWIAGLPYDAVHGVGNIILCALLFDPICKVIGSRNLEPADRIHRSDEP